MQQQPDEAVDDELEAEDGDPTISDILTKLDAIDHRINMIYHYITRIEFHIGIEDKELDHG